MSRKAVILIPALDPPRRELRVLLEELYRFSPGRGILLVNDGSREEYNSFFRELQKEFPDLLLLENSRNMGKGYSLRKGIAFILENFPSSPLITCDCDGQHSAADIEKIAALAEKEKLDLILGVREFSGKNIPFRSFLGNRVASFSSVLSPVASLPTPRPGSGPYPPPLPLPSSGIAGGMGMNGKWQSFLPPAGKISPCWR